MRAHSRGTSNDAAGVTTATILLFIWALLTYSTRIWAKLSKGVGWGADETAISLSGLAIVCNVALICFAVHRGYCKPWTSLVEKDRLVVYKSLYASQLFYILSIGLTNISVNLFTARFLALGQQRTRWATNLTVLCGMWTAASLLAVSIRDPASAPWDTLDGSQPLFIRWLVVEITNFILDVCTIALPVHLVWGLRMPLKKRLAASTIFSIRILSTPVVGLRLYHLSPSQNPDSNIPSHEAQIFTQIAVVAAFMLASITCLKPFLRPFHDAHDFNSGVVDPYSEYDRRCKHARIATNQHKEMPDQSIKKGPSLREDPIHAQSEPPSLRSDCCAYEVSARAGEEEDQVVRTGILGSGLISKNQMWSVSYTG